MKKLLFFAAISFMFVTAANAQNHENWGNNSNRSSQNWNNNGNQGQWQKGNHQSPMANMNLTQDQKDQMKKISEDTRAQVKAIQNDNSLSQDQKEAKIKGLRTAQREKMNSILTPDQQKQMANFRSQNKKWEHSQKNDKNLKEANKGMKNFGNIDLTQDQKDKMASIKSDFKSQKEAIKKDNSLTKEQKSEKIKALNQSERDQMSSILTLEQKEQMKGKNSQRRMKGNRSFGMDNTSKNS